MCDGHLVGHFKPIPTSLSFDSYIASVPVSLASLSKHFDIFVFFPLLIATTYTELQSFPLLDIPHYKMGGQASNQMTVANALVIAKENQNGQIPTAVTQVLEKNIGDIWKRIQAQPSTYLMKKEEYAVFAYYRTRYDNNPMAQQAVARFWNHFKGDVDGAPSSSSSPTAAGGPSPPRGQGSSGVR